MILCASFFFSIPYLLRNKFWPFFHQWITTKQPRGMPTSVCFIYYALCVFSKFSIQSTQRQCYWQSLWREVKRQPKHPEFFLSFPCWGVTFNMLTFPLKWLVCMFLYLLHMRTTLIYKFLSSWFELCTPAYIHVYPPPPSLFQGAD